MRIHFISIGGAIMHNMALALQENGHNISGSDDTIYDPSRSRLQAGGLLPPEFGWFPEKITTELDLVILGKHAKLDNPELAKAKDLGLSIHSFPSFIAEFASEKKKVVVAGSHGKTTTTSMIMHCLNVQGIDHDYLVGAQLEGYQNMVKLSDANLMIIEGDEYLSSPIDDSPKFLHYKPDICILTGIEWDHINVFKTFESYVHQFELLLKSIDDQKAIYAYANDPEVVKLIEQFPVKNIHSYKPFSLENGQITYGENKYPIHVFGNHNMANMNAAFQVCKDLGVSESDFFKAMQTFKGAAKRQELILENDKQKIYWDFAHAPSKVRATAEAFVSAFQDEKIAVVLELHTYSSLTKDFLPMYKNSLEGLDQGAIFFNPRNLEIKNMAALEPSYIRESFQEERLEIIENPADLEHYLKNLAHEFEGIVLIMSSGQLGGVELAKIFQ